MDGINAFIDHCPDDIHLEFKLAGIKPEKWEIADSLSILYYMGYSTSANLNTEIVAQMLLKTLGFEKTSQIMPLNINADDPDDTGKTQMPFIRMEETLKIKDKDDPKGFKQETFIIRATKRGPVVSNVFPDLKTKNVITLRFAPAESMEPAIGLSDILTAKNSEDLVRASKLFPMVCLNLVFADTGGNIGHQASGKIPIRYHGDGSFPFPVKDSKDNWHGWIPADEMPGTINPEKNWIGTCNHKTIKNDFPYYYSSYFAPSYRYRRLKELMASSGKKSVNDLWRYQRDTKNFMTQKKLRLLSFKPLTNCLPCWFLKMILERKKP